VDGSGAFEAANDFSISLAGVASLTVDTDGASFLDLIIDAT
jgi:hypothetical protein